MKLTDKKLMIRAGLEPETFSPTQAGADALNNSHKLAHCCLYY